MEFGFEKEDEQGKLLLTMYLKQILGRNVDFSKPASTVKVIINIMFVT